MQYKFEKRLSVRPNYEAGSAGGIRCPEVWELADGSIAVIGQDITSNVEMPQEVIIDPKERVVVIPRSVFDAALKAK